MAPQLKMWKNFLNCKKSKIKKRIGNFWSNNNIEYESNSDRK